MTGRVTISPGARGALSTLLREYDAYRAAEVLTVVAALSELALCLEETAAGRLQRFESDRGSLMADVELALTRVGPSLERATKPSLREVRTRELSRLGAVFQDVNKGGRSASIVRHVIDDLRGASAIAAAWDDLVASLSDGAASCAECALRVAQVVELVELRGHDWTAMQVRLTSLLADGALEKVRAAVVAAPPTDVSVVWLALGNAWLGDGYLRVGQVQFFRDVLEPQYIRDGCPALNFAEFERATELTDVAVKHFFRDIEPKPYVLVRVELSGARAHAPPGGYSKPPIAWARDLVRGIVEAAGFRQGGTEWLLLDGGFYFTASGNTGGTLGFGNPLRREAMRSFCAPRNDHTDDALRKLDSSFADALARGDRAARFAVDEVIWHRRARDVRDTAMQVALHVRGFETHWVTGRAALHRSWDEPVKRYLRDHWVRHYMDDFIHDAAHEIRHERRAVSDSRRLDAAVSDIFVDGPNLSYTWTAAAAIRHAPTVASDFAAGSLARRQLKELARATRTGTTAQNWWRVLRCSFDTLLNRAMRQRNAIIHGRALVPGVVESVEPFLARVSAYLAAKAVDAATHGNDVDASLETGRTELDSDYSSLANEPSGEALYPTST